MVHWSTSSVFSTVWDADTHATQSLFYAQRCQHWRHNEGGMTSDTASKRQDELVEKEVDSEEEAPGMGGVRCGAQEVGGPPEGLRVRTERFKRKRAVSTPSRSTHTWVRSMKHDARITEGK